MIDLLQKGIISKKGDFIVQIWIIFSSQLNQDLRVAEIIHLNFLIKTSWVYISKEQVLKPIIIPPPPKKKQNKTKNLKNLKVHRTK